MALGDNTAALQEILERTKKLPDVSAAVLYTPQELTAEQQAQARNNIGALAESELDAAVDDALAQAKESGDFKGDKGDTGANGVSATHSWNGTVLTVTSASGTSSANLKGEKGDKGDPGSAGKTPAKGTDYWTAEDRAAIVNDVLAALPTWDGGSY